MRSIGRRLFYAQRLSTDSTTRSIRFIVYRLIRPQAVVVVAVTLCSWIKGEAEGLSALLGGSVCVLPSLFSAWRLFAITSSRTAKRIVISLFLGELIKLMLSAVLVMLTVVFIPVSIIPFAIGFVGAQFGFLFAPLEILGSRSKKAKSTQ